MIDVQAELEAHGRCFVTFEHGIVGGFFKRDKQGCEQYRREGGTLLIYDDPFRLTEDQAYCVSLDGLNLVALRKRSKHRNYGMEVYMRELDYWRKNSPDPLQCVAWLLNFEDCVNGEWDRLLRGS